MATRARHIDWASLAIVVITFVLFGVAVIEKGLTHDLLLEAGVFLVSVKLILMNAKASIASDEMTAKLGEIQSALDRIEASATSAGVDALSRSGRAGA